MGGAVSWSVLPKKNASQEVALNPKKPTKPTEVQSSVSWVRNDGGEGFVEHVQRLNRGI